MHLDIGGKKGPVLLPSNLYRSSHGINAGQCRKKLKFTPEKKGVSQVQMSFSFETSFPLTFREFLPFSNDYK